METMIGLDNIVSGPLGATLILVVSLICLILWYSARKQRYWKERGVPTADTVPIFGSILGTMNKPSHEVELKRYMKYGPIYGHFEGNIPLLSVGEPTLLKNIMVKDFHIFNSARKLPDLDNISGNMLSFLSGEDWKRVRSIVSPAFTTGKIKKMLGIFKESAATLCANFLEYAERDKDVEVKSVYGAFTMDVIASSAFSTKLNSYNDPNNEFAKTAKNFFSMKITWKFIVLFFCPPLKKFMKLNIFSPKALGFFAQVTRQIIDERQKTRQTPNDFLQLLIDTAKQVEEENTANTNKENEDIISNYGTTDDSDVIRSITIKKSLSFEELVAQCVSFFFAGYETTATTLSLASYLLALHPDVQEKLIAEVDEVLSATNGKVTYEAVQGMKYLDNVISETLRMYPPAVRTERLAYSDYELGNTGITIPKGMTVSIPIYAMHKNPNFFPDPEKFDPDRFTPEGRAKRDPYCYMPFGSGPRSCVGMRFALLEMKVCLTYVLSRFRITRSERTKVPLEFDTGQLLLQCKEIYLKMEKRVDGIESH